jgi:predicted RNA-binding protein with RPS1 domain
LIILDEETNGLVHTSELEKTSRRLTAGEDVKVKVIAVDRMSRKIFLSVA